MYTNEKDKKVIGKVIRKINEFGLKNDLNPLMDELIRKIEKEFGLKHKVF